MKILALSGMPGAGKTLASNFARERGFTVLRLGDLTDEELQKKGWERNEENERKIRESLREEFGMAVYAIKVSEKIEKLPEDTELVVLDGVRSFEEYKILKEKFGDDFSSVSILTAADERYKRLETRRVRKLSEEEAKSRDKSELSILNHGSTIAKGDYYIINEDLTIDEYKKQVNDLFDKILESSEKKI